MCLLLYDCIAFAVIHHNISESRTEACQLEDVHVLPDTVHSYFYWIIVLSAISYYVYVHHIAILLGIPT